MATNDANTVLMIRGTLVGLGPLRQDLAETYQRWINDLRVTRTLALPPMPMTLAAESAWLESASIGREPHFTIYDLAAMRPIGTTGLHAVNHSDGTAEFGIMIGEPDAWGRGFGTEATVLMRSYAFDVLGLHHLRLEVYAHNIGAIRAYERAGFQLVGTLREAKRIGRERVDVLVMDVLANDAEPGPLHALIAPGDVRHGGTH
ncbi:MAG: GNAT family N-acetyltransferase [Thermomicrobiales bacterium]|nr:GNAT family N-acetyltransferase [Thermomicrobiales bacterium]